MPQTRHSCGTAVSNGSIVLMARVVDGDSANIRPADMAAIEYSIYEVDLRRPRDFALIPGHDAVVVDVDDVVFDSLQTGGLWTADDVGFNFRHEITLGERVFDSQADGHVEVRYTVKSAMGETTIIRFQLKAI